MSNVIIRIRCLLFGHDKQTVLNQGFNVFLFCPRQYAWKCKRCGFIRAFDNGMPVEDEFHSINEVKLWAKREKKNRERLLNSLTQSLSAKG